jgi:hypothetical protein
MLGFELRVQLHLALGGSFDPAPAATLQTTRSAA